MSNREEPMLDLAKGDIGMSRALSKALKILADSGVDKGLEKQMREIASGNGSLRDLMHSEAFMRLSDATVPQALAERAAKTPEELQRLAEQGEAVLEYYRRESGVTPAGSGSSDGPDTGTQPSSRENPQAGADASVSPPHDASSADQARSGVPSSRRPRREVVFTPDEPDEDDLYFQERHRNGWLQ